MFVQMYFMGKSRKPAGEMSSLTKFTLDFGDIIREFKVVVLSDGPKISKPNAKALGLLQVAKGFLRPPVAHSRLSWSHQLI